MKYKLGFVVGHPTQFEGPMYQYINGLGSESPLHVYFFNHANKSFHDAELGSKNKQSWGIDILSGYKWTLLKKIRYQSIKKILDENEYIIVNGYNSRICLCILLLGKIYGKKIGLRYDTVLWNNEKIYKRIYKYILLKILNFFVDSFWGTGSKSKEYLIFFGIKENKINKLSYIIDNDWFNAKSNLSEEEIIKVKSKYGVSQNHKVILCVTKLVERELPIDVINAFNDINNPSLTLLIVGDGAMKTDLESYVKCTLKNRNIKFLGYVNYLNLPQMYAISDLFIHPSKNEPWGVSIQEAIACGKPVIYSNFVGAGFDLIKEGVNGYMYQYNNKEELIEKIKKALSFNIQDVVNQNNKILSDWNYQRTWEHLLKHLDN